MAFTIGTATFTNGSKDVSGVSLTSGKTSYFDTGTRMVVSSNPVIAEVEAVSAPSVNSIRLAENWPHATGTYPFLANMTAEGVVGLAERIRDYIGRVQGETAALVNLYDSTVNGIARTVTGEYFNVLVPSDPDVYSELYLNSNGTAVFQVSMPTKAALDAATQSAQLSESNAATSEQNAAASETKSQEWAENPEDVAVEAGQYSALHWSAKSQDFSANSAGSATLSEKWASEAENIEVEPGLYSALHWAAKAEGFATSITPTVAPTPDTAVQRTNTGATRVADAVNADEAVAKGQFPAGFDLSGAYAKNNILGTASQSGGVPTGAIIERGSNANGDYVKFADGTLICWVNMLSNQGATGDGAAAVNTDAFITTIPNWTYPAQFSQISSFVGFPAKIDIADSINPVSVSRLTGSPLSLTSLDNMYVINLKGASPVVSFLVSLQTIGRWY